jgi:cytochrome c oxidase assembly protein subunit 15
MVVLGGVTRLTRSGLSMTDWKFQWESPPLCAEDWAREFAKYRASPEFRLSNASMTVDEYKFIFWMEYGHRMWGRGLGVYFALPLCAFLAKGWITKRLGARLVSFFGLGAAQGAIGWWMVKSGLTLDAENPLNVPRVSPYRLATHLTGAFTIYTAMLWTTFSVLFPETNSAGGGGIRKNAAATSAATSLRRKAFPLAGLIAVTALSGAYVAGLDAGRAYNTFPLMDGKVVPELYWSQWEEKGWRNFFENDAAVQFDHRALAIATLVSTAATFASTSKTATRALPKRATFFLHATAGLVTAQVALGIATLLCHVPVSLGSAHQANALLVFTAAVGLTHALKTKRPDGAARVAAAAARGTRGTAAKAAEHAHAGVPVAGG